jgi:hypothetical protein
MQRLILAFVLGMFSPGSRSQSAGFGSLLPASASVTTVLVAAQPAVAEGAAARNLAAPVVGRHDAAVARGTVKHTKEAGERGRVAHRFEFQDGTVVEFTTRPRGSRETASRSRVLSFSGTHKAAEEPDSTFEAAGRAAGLSPDAVEALRFISRHEGGFDAINTWDTARFSWGFIQFAGGYGLRPMLGYFKGQSPELFHKLLAGYGVDVLPGKDGKPVPTYVDPDSGKVLRGDAAEQAYGDDPLVIALFIRAGRVPAVKQLQVEVAMHDYAVPALEATHAGARLSEVFRSPQGLATLIDRKVQEGNLIRLEWALENAWAMSSRPGPSEWPKLEAAALDYAIQDAEARTQIRELVDGGADMLVQAAAAARGGEAAYVPNGPTLEAGRLALQEALSLVDGRMVTSYRRDVTRAGLLEALGQCSPGSVAVLSASDMAAVLERAAASARGVVSRFRYEGNIRDRLRGIRLSSLRGPA